VLVCEQLYADAHCHQGALDRISEFHTFFSEWPFAVILLFRNTLLALFWSLVAWIAPSSLLSCPNKQLPSAFWQIMLHKLFRLVWRMCVHTLFRLIFGVNIHRWNPGFIFCYSYNVIENS
jgi:hypothetical protein